MRFINTKKDCDLICFIFSSPRQFFFIKMLRLGDSKMRFSKTFKWSFGVSCFNRQLETVFCSVGQKDGFLSNVVDVVQNQVDAVVKPSNNRFATLLAAFTEGLPESRASGTRPTALEQVLQKVVAEVLCSS
jgi:hypothetical protein